MTSALLVRQARRAERLSQRDLARRAGLHQPAIAAIEGGVRDTRVGQLDRLLAATGRRLVALPTWAPTAADCAEDIYDALHQPDTRSGEEVAFRHLIGFSDALAAQEPSLRVALCVAPPPATGDRRFDAALAATVEYHLRRDNLPVPPWVDEPDRTLEDDWVVDPYAGEDIAVRTPEPFRRRRVLLAASELASV